MTNQLIDTFENSRNQFVFVFWDSKKTTLQYSTDKNYWLEIVNKTGVEYEGSNIVPLRIMCLKYRLLFFEKYCYEL